MPKKQIQNPIIIKSSEDMRKEGCQFTPAQAKEAEQFLLLDPTDLTRRIQLLGYYNVFRGKGNFLTSAKNYTRHLSWMIENHPSERILASCKAWTSSAPFIEVKDLWQKAIAVHPNEVEILVNAAASLKIGWPKIAEEYYLSALKLAPDNEKYFFEIVELWFFHSELQRHSNKQKSLELVKRGIATATQAATLLMKNEAKKYNNQELRQLLHYSACKALEYGLVSEAKFFGECLVDSSIANHKDEKKCKVLDFDMARAGHCFLGKTSLSQGYRQQAAIHLVEMSKLGEPFDLSLAQELLNQGDKSTVLNYLRAVRKLVKAESDRLLASSSGKAVKHSVNIRATKQLQSQIQKISNWEAAITSGKKPKFRMTVSGFLY